MKSTIALLCILLTAPPAISQSSARQATTSSTQTRANQSSADALNKRVAELEKKFAVLQNELNLDELLIQSKEDRHEWIPLDPSAHTFQLLDGDESTFLVMLDDVSPYLNGYRIKLKIGNPADADFANVTLSVKWAKAYDLKHYSEESFKEWQKSVHEKDVTLTDNLIAGSWNAVSIDLVPCAATEIGYLEISIKTPSVLLHTP